MSTPADLAQRQMALDLEHSVCIRAPAGSGKTGLLIQRLLKALASVDQPEAVLAITFTRKAAAEIQQRLLNALNAARDKPPEAAFERQTWTLARAVLERDTTLNWALTDNPARIRATTIDALNRELASLNPILSGLGGLPEPVEDAAPLYREAILACFARFEARDTDPGLRHDLAQVLRLAHNRLDRLIEAISTLLATREQWLRACLHSSQEGPATAQSALARLLTQRLQSLHRALPVAARQEWLEVLKAQAAQGIEVWQFTRDLTTWPAASADNMALWQQLAGSLITAGGEWRKPRGLTVRQGFPPGDITQRARGLIEEFAAAGDDLAVELAQLSKLPREYPPELAEQAAALNRVLLQCCAELKLIFAARQQADYAELALGALDALRDTGSGAGERQMRLAHLLVDEMQDTSLAQIELLERLVDDWQTGDGRSLFLVGDPQQSIYLFRQARVELFQGIIDKARLGPVPLRNLALSCNFRARPALVDWCNDTLGAVFARRHSPIRFAASDASRGGAGGEVRIHACDSREDEARHAADLIEQALEGEGRIGVLARSRGHFSGLIEQLKARGIRYAGQDLDPLGDTPVARNALACLLALRHPADDLAWLRLLRSPGVGLSWSALDALAAEAPARPWSQRIQLTPDALDSEARARLARLRECLQQWRQRQDLISNLPRAARWLHAQLGMRADLGAAQMADLLQVEAVIAAHCEAGQLRDEAALQRALGRLYSSPASARVELMTVHRSKGLEFEHVLLIGCANKLRGGDNPLLRHREIGQDWLTATRPALDLRHDTVQGRIYRLLNDAVRQDEAAESLRLFYVACTRARDQLHILLHPPRQHDARSFAMQLHEAGQLGELTRNSTPREPRWQPVLHPALPLEALRPATTAGPPGQLAAPPQSPSRLASAQRDRAEVALNWTRLEATLVGTLTHECLERLSHLTPHPAAQDLANWRPALRAGLARRGLPEARLDAACRRILNLTQACLAGWGLWLLAPHVWARSEYAVSGWREDRWISAIIDRCLIDAQQRLWVIDYKTHEPPEDAGSDWPLPHCPDYEAQLALYAELLADLHPNHPVGKLLYFVATDTLMRQTGPDSWVRVENPAELMTNTP